MVLFERIFPQTFNMYGWVYLELKISLRNKIYKIVLTEKYRLKCVCVCVCVCLHVYVCVYCVYVDV